MLIGVPGSFYVTFIGVMLVVVVIANTRLSRLAGGAGMSREIARAQLAPAPGDESTAPLPPVFELNQVSHSYGRNKVIFDVNLSVWPGEVVGLVGDNGAGKSTLLKIFAGYQKPTGGHAEFHGQAGVVSASPADARAMGIEAVYQDLAIVDQLNLWQNFFLGKELKRQFGPLRIMDRKAMRKATVARSPNSGLTRIRSADEPVWALSGGERQSVAITRANHFGAKLLLLDEPTAALSVRETRNVLESIGRAREPEASASSTSTTTWAMCIPVADRIVLLELGRVVRVIDRGEVSVEELQEMVAQRHQLLG